MFGVIVLFIIKRFSSIFFTSVLILLGILSFALPRYIAYGKFIGFELCTLATVLTSLSYGPHYGAFTGLVTIFFGFVFGGHFKPTYFISVLTMPVIGLITPLFSDLPLLWIGVLMTLLYDAIILPLYVFIGGSKITSVIIFGITHLFLNAWIFATLAPLIRSVMV